jgi:hypothetical protein
LTPQKDFLLLISVRLVNARASAAGRNRQIEEVQLPDMCMCISTDALEASGRLHDPEALPLGKEPTPPSH